MIDWWQLLFDAIWLIGLALMLAVRSYERFRAERKKPIMALSKSSPESLDHGFAAGLCFCGMELVFIGVALGASDLAVQLIAVMGMVLGIIRVLQSYFSR